MPANKLADNARHSERMKQHQPGRIPIHSQPPFLQVPANFGSARTRPQLDQSQAGQIIPIPPTKRAPSVFELAEVVGQQYADEISQSGQVVFHCGGDTGFGGAWDVELVAQVMAMDLLRPNPADRPAFFFHLGDVIYNHQYNMPESKENMYQPQFYVPYEHYSAKIVAIPGNHDSNPQEDPKSIDAFEENFCADPPKSDTDLAKLLSAPNRAPMFQPGVYYRLDTPFAQIIALFSNGGEHEGVLRGGVAGDSQWNFPVEQLTEIKAARDAGKRLGLIVAMHHPPYSGGGGHSGSTTMLADLDAAFNEAKIGPDAVLSGHAHVYQRFTRTTQVAGIDMEVPYVVAGMGGHGPIQPVKPSLDRQPVRTPIKGRSPNGAEDHSLRQYFNGFGHLIVTATNRVLTIDLIGTKTQTHQAVDSVTADLATSKVTHVSQSLGRTITGDQLGALVVGRWKDGTPVILSSAPDASISRDDMRINYFAYGGISDIRVVRDRKVEAVPGHPADVDGLRCPHFAHVRKVNPRDQTTNKGQGEFTQLFQMLRRGIPFGPLYDEKPEAERGLLFLAYQTSFNSQFRELNTDWMNNPDAPELGNDGYDLLVGQNGDGTARIAPLHDSTANVDVRVTAPTQFVIPTGGAFLFSPSISFLRAL